MGANTIIFMRKKKLLKLKPLLFSVFWTGWQMGEDNEHDGDGIFGYIGEEDPSPMGRARKWFESTFNHLLNPLKEGEIRCEFIGYEKKEALPE
jgi:hypothetical protein